MSKKIDIRVKSAVNNFTMQVYYLLHERENFDVAYNNLSEEFFSIAQALFIDSPEDLWGTLRPLISSVVEKIWMDAEATERNDPAAKSLDEVFLAYPGFFAVSIYRVSHEMHKLNIPLLPRMMSEYAHSYTGTDIHPGAQIGESFFIDHATGIVIGETVSIGNHVKIYQGVTLGAFHIKKSLASTKRHPTIEDNVTIYANATILGGDTVVGSDSVIGASVWLTESVPSNSYVIHNSDVKIKTK